MTAKRNPDLIRKRRETPLQNWKMAMERLNLNAEREKQGLNGAIRLLPLVGEVLPIGINRTKWEKFNIERNE
jgi:hypothetical protein